MNTTPARNTKVMNRFDVTSRLIAKLKHEEAVVGGIGNTNFDLFAAGHRPENFYMLGSMGLAIPIALGVALAQPERGVVALGHAARERTLGVGDLLSQRRQIRLRHHRAAGEQTRGERRVQSEHVRLLLLNDQTSSSTGASATAPTCAA